MKLIFDRSELIKILNWEKIANLRQSLPSMISMTRILLGMINLRFINQKKKNLKTFRDDYPYFGKARHTRRPADGSRTIPGMRFSTLTILRILQILQIFIILQVL